MDMTNFDISIEYADSLYSTACDMIEQTYDISYKFLGYSPIAEDLFFSTEEEAINYLIQSDEVFLKCSHLDFNDIVVPVYDQEGQLLYFLPYDEAMLLKGG